MICAVILCCTGFAGCQNPPASESVPMPSYHALLSDHTDSIDGAMTYIEYDMSPDNVNCPPPPSDTWTITFNGIVYTGTYYKSYYLDKIADYTHYYEDDTNDIRIIVDSAGNLVQYLDRRVRDSEPGNPLTAQECQQIAEEAFSQYANPSEYTIHISQLQEDKYYIVYFNKILPGDIYTMDCGLVKILPDGRIYNLTLYMLDRFPDDIPAEYLSKDAAKAAVQERLDEMLSGAREKYDNIEYIYHTMEFTILRDGRYAFLCDVTVRCYDESGIRKKSCIYSFVIPVSEAPA